MPDPNLPTVDRQMLSTLVAGARVTFANAEALYHEGRLLAGVGARARSLVLHQISLEECSKIDTIGGWVTSLLVGKSVDPKSVLNAMRAHRAKNNANAYSLEASEAERDARQRSDWPAAIEEFRKIQKVFHEESNDAKNAALYVDFRHGAFTGPVDVITDEMLAKVLARNEQFLAASAMRVRTLESMEAETESRQRFAIALMIETSRLKDLNAGPEVVDNMIQRFMDGEFGPVR